MQRLCAESPRGKQRRINCAPLSDSRKFIVTLIVIQILGTGALLLGHLFVVVRNQLTRSR
jgi:hypothetical protein